jgi:hypothetical protein
MGRLTRISSGLVWRAWTGPCRPTWTTGRGVAAFAAASIETPAARAPTSIFAPLLPPCFPEFGQRGGEAKTTPKGRSKKLIFLKFGAREGIRTLDPNLGKGCDHCGSNLAASQAFVEQHRFRKKPF